MSACMRYLMAIRAPRHVLQTHTHITSFPSMEDVKEEEEEEETTREREKVPIIQEPSRSESHANGAGNELNDWNTRPTAFVQTPSNMEGKHGRGVRRESRERERERKGEKDLIKK